MDSAPSDHPVFAPHKMLIAGGFGVGKTTFVGAISEVRPLRTEEALTTASVGLDDLTASEQDDDDRRDGLRPYHHGTELVLYLFGTPGQERFWFMWDELSYGALGAVVLADTRRLDDCFPSVDYFEKRGLPFVVALNCFDGAPRYDPDDVREALDLDAGVPVVLCDAGGNGLGQATADHLGGARPRQQDQERLRRGGGPQRLAGITPETPQGQPRAAQVRGAAARAGVTAQAPPPQLPVPARSAVAEDERLVGGV